MAKNWIMLIPEKAGYVPSPEKQAGALKALKELVIDAGKPAVKVTKEYRFEDTGEDFGWIRCPKSGQDIPYELWDVFMNEGQEDKQGKLRRHDLVCCGTKHTLHQLRYQAPVGWTKFSLTFKQAQPGRMKKNHVVRLQKILGCELRVIYRRKETL